MKQKNDIQTNAGFSLVELMVVVAIMGLLMSVFAISYFVVGRANAKSYAHTFDRALSTSQDSTMGRVEGFDLYYNLGTDGCGYIRVGKTGKPMKISDSKIPFSYWDGTKFIETKPQLKFTFDKASGALKAIYFNETVSDTIDAFSTLQLGGDAVSEYMFQFGSSSGTHYVVHLIRPTGKHFVE